MGSIEKCASEILLERECKETSSRLIKIFLFPGFFLFFSFLEWVFPPFLIFHRVSNPFFRRSFSSFSSFRLSRLVPSFLMGLNLAILERVLHEKLSKLVLCHSTSRSSPFQKSILIFLQPVFLGN